MNKVSHDQSSGELRSFLTMDPVPGLLSFDNMALRWFIRRDLLEEKTEPVTVLWKLPGTQKILRKQNEDGSLGNIKRKQPAAVNIRLIETWKQFRFLIDMYGSNRKEPGTARAAEFIFSCQTEEGDFRGFLADQYATYYTGALLGLLCNAGYTNDPRVERGFQWLLSMRQDDGGWTIPLLTHYLDGQTMYRFTSSRARPLEPDRTQPFSHNWTGMVLRAFAAHPVRRSSAEARHAAALLTSRFFTPDCYSSYRSADYWVRFQYPFWWNNLVSALDSVTLILPRVSPEINQALSWLKDHQASDGLWKLSYRKTGHADPARAKEMRGWVTLAICRVIKRILSKQHIYGGEA
ncbi:MAG TPA: hypothetical protein ENN69_08820 [Spirochaetia bacterium]|nr:hypothetical protein [Spirochaetia bacterium]